MIEKNIRVRFAPAPTGIMHLGNVRTALMNYLFALKYNGTSIIRIEDTDAQRNFDPSGEIIIKDLAWLGITYHEGPLLGGEYGPYIQSQRTGLYDQHLTILQQKKQAYRCFCTEAELDNKRKRQQALHQPPRYDRTCMNLSEDEINKKLSVSTPFIWRVIMDHDHEITIHDLAHGNITFALKNFSDFPITRQDGSFTFLFANFVDDMTMHITHVFRGEDHLTNTACQAWLYQLFNCQIPTFWHMPIICNIDGKKLSKRDFGFSLHTLRDAGFLPEAITNYLGIIGTSCEQEIMSLSEMSTTLNLLKPAATGAIKYDCEKLRWINHKWIARYDAIQLAKKCRPFLQEVYHDAVAQMNDTTLATLLKPIQSDLVTLHDSVAALHFYFVEPTISDAHINACIGRHHFASLAPILEYTPQKIDTAKNYIDHLHQEAKKNNITSKELYSLLRLALTGAPHGVSIVALVEMLGIEKSVMRINTVSHLLKRIL